MCINSSKTEFLLIGLKQQFSIIDHSLLNTTHSAKNLGFIFDKHLAFLDRVTGHFKSYYYHNPLTRSMYWRRASIQDGQASTSIWWCHCSETVFRDNLVIFIVDRKNSIFGISEFSTCEHSTQVIHNTANWRWIQHTQLFNFRDVMRPLFATIQWPIFAKCLITDSPD